MLICLLPQSPPHSEPYELRTRAEKKVARNMVRARLETVRILSCNIALIVCHLYQSPPTYIPTTTQATNPVPRSTYIPTYFPTTFMPTMSPTFVDDLGQAYKGPLPEFVHVEGGVHVEGKSGKGQKVVVDPGYLVPYVPPETYPPTTFMPTTYPPVSLCHLCYTFAPGVISPMFVTYWSNVNGVDGRS